MITLTQTWKNVFWGFIVAFVLLIFLSFVLQFIPLFALALVDGVVICVLAMGKLRCPHCRKFILQEALKVKLEGEVTCPKCRSDITIC